MFQEFRESISAYGTAIQLIATNRLWRYVLLPGLISLLTMILLVAGPVTWFFNSDIEQQIISLWPFEFGLGFVEGVVDVFALILALGIIFFLGKYLVMVIVAPFMGPLSEKVERIMTGEEVASDSNFMEDLMRGLRIALRNLFREIFITLGLLLLNFLPIIGSIAATGLTFLVQSYFAGFGNMDYTLERKQYNVQESVAFVGQHRGLAVGNGAVFLLLLLIPIAGWFLAPAFATVSATAVLIKRIP